MESSSGTFPSVRYRYNQALTDALLRQFLDGRLLLAEAKALMSQASQRPMQIYARDPHVQAAVTEGGLDGGPAEHDYVGVYTQDTNASCVDSFQSRSMRQQVQLLTDGSALVARTVRVASPVSEGMRRTAAHHSMPIVATDLPPTATFAGGGRRRSALQERRRVARSRSAFRWRRCQARTGPFGHGGRRVQGSQRRRSDDRRLTLRVRGRSAAPMSQPPRLELRVTAPTGMAVQPGEDCEVQGQRATLTLPLLVERSRASLDLHRD